MLRIADPKRNPLVIESPAYKSQQDINSIVKDFEDRIKRYESQGFRVAGFFYEPIMGVRGAVELTREYLEPITEICRDKDVLLIADEVTTGIGRTGKLFGYEHTGIKPDIMVLGKGISAGYYPLSTTLVDQKIVDTWDKLLENGEAFGEIHSRGNGVAGTPEACAIGLKVLEIVQRDNLIEEVRRKGEYALKKLKPIEDLDNVREVRGKGLLISVDVKDSKLAQHAKVEMRKRGINALPEGRMLMFCPSYLITENEIDLFSGELEKILAVA